MIRRTLPIGMQTFREVRERDCYYVDKTAWIRRLLDKGKHYFLSRPRRFGKSLLLDTSGPARCRGSLVGLKLPQGSQTSAERTGV